MAEMSPDERDQLVVDHYRMAKAIGAHFASKPHSQAWEPDITGAVLEALVRCSRRYDPARGVPFSGYCRPRLRSAAIDAWRNIVHGRRVGGLRILECLPDWFDVPDVGLSVEDLALVDVVELEYLLDRLDPGDGWLARQLLLEGRTGRDVAAELGVTESAVSHRLVGIRHRLRVFALQVRRVS